MSDGIPTGLFAFAEPEPDVFEAEASGGPLLRLFGGQVLSQALAAAQRTAPSGRLVHSCHAYFLRAGSPDHAIQYRVARDSDGRSFSARRVMAVQQGRTILTLSASMHEDEPGDEQHVAMPDMPSPDTLPRQDDVMHAALPHMPDYRRAFWDRDTGVDFRAVEPFVTRDPPRAPASRHFWVRVKQRMADDPALHQQMLAYLSDFYFMHTGLAPLGQSWAAADLQDVSLDHAIWFHKRFRADEWLLYAMDSPYSGGARTLARGTFFTQDGDVVASVAQEGLIRVTRT